jgi:predicted TIM-barrel fold metal-dependent hydrolase
MQRKLQKAPDLILRNYHPMSMLVTEYHVPQRAKFQVIDVHNHLGNVESRGSAMDPAACIKEMDAAGIAQVVNLDPRFDPIWTKCGELKIPIEIHVGDPAAFFTPLDKNNERYEELQDHPDWLFYPGYPPLETILAQLINVVARHPRTTFIGAHVGCYAEDLKWVSERLDKYSNFFVSIDARISELGRQPYAARKFLIKYQDRVLFGTDTSPDAEAYRIYYQFLETADEYFDVARSHHYQGRWMVYGMYLPDEVLEKIYYRNAVRLIPGAGIRKRVQSR